MARSIEDLANAALGYLVRDASVRSIDDSGPSAVQMKANWRSAMEFVQCEYDWPESRVISKLTSVSSIPLRGWSYSYQVPSDCVKLWGIDDGQTAGRGYTIIPFEMGMAEDVTSDRTYIFTNQAGAYGRYASSRVSISRFGPQVFDLIAIRLAIQACMALTKDKALNDRLTKLYDKNLSKIKTNYANNEPEQTDIDFVPEFISVRSE